MKCDSRIPAFPFDLRESANGLIPVFPQSFRMRERGNDLFTGETIASVPGTRNHHKTIMEIQIYTYD